jgi:hypothetical protein
MNPNFCKGFEKIAIALPALGGVGKFLTAGFIGLEAANAFGRAASRTNSMRAIKGAGKMTGTVQAMNNVPRHTNVSRGIGQTFSR